MGLGKELLAYFEPSDKDILLESDGNDIDSLGDNVQFLDIESPDSFLDKAQIVILSIPESPEAFEIKKQLYSLSCHFPKDAIIDMGSVRPGKTKADTESAIKDVIAELNKRNKTIIVLGGKSENTVNLYRAYSTLEQIVNICGIDARIPLSINEEITKFHYLNEILLNPENKLFNYSHLAYQAYFVSPEVQELLDKLFFSHIRLGNIRNDIMEAEPEFRNTDILSFSMSSIRSSDAPFSSSPGPNGLYAEEACQLGRYAGLSDRLSCFFINSFSSVTPDNKGTSALAAQIIWHFLQGVFQRKKEYPYSDLSNYQKFIVNVPQIGHDIHFFKSPKTNRWWIEVPYSGEKFKRFLYVACSPSDYQAACEGEIPDRWWKNFQRIS